MPARDPGRRSIEALGTWSRLRAAAEADGRSVRGPRDRADSAGNIAQSAENPQSAETMQKIRNASGNSVHFVLRPFPRSGHYEIPRSRVFEVVFCCVLAIFCGFFGLLRGLV